MVGMVVGEWWGREEKRYAGEHSALVCTAQADTRVRGMGHPCIPEIAFAARVYAGGAGEKCGGHHRDAFGRAGARSISPLERFLLDVAVHGATVRAAARLHGLSASSAYEHWDRFAKSVAASAAEGYIPLGVAQRLVGRVERRPRHPAVCRPREEIAAACARLRKHEEPVGL